jgi:hypothetical protein
MALAIDISDKQIKLIHAFIDTSSIYISEYATRVIPQGCVENGYIKNLPLVLEQIEAIFANLEIVPRDVVICVNSNAIGDGFPQPMLDLYYALFNVQLKFEKKRIRFCDGSSAHVLSAPDIAKMAASPSDVFSYPAYKKAIGSFYAT